MSTSIQWDGLNEFRHALQNLPEELATEAAHVVTETTNAVQRAVVSGYPLGRTGNLARRVSVSTSTSGVSTVGVVRSNAPHASIFEKGTTLRHTAKGYNRGRMPKPDASQRMIPKVQAARALMTRRLIDIVKKAGFEVDG